MVAQYADACNLFVQAGDEEVIRKLDILKQHCKDVGRNYNDIEKTTLYQIREAVDPKKVINDLKHIHKLGFSHVILGIRNVNEIEPVKIIAEKVIPQVSKL